MREREWKSLFDYIRLNSQPTCSLSSKLILSESDFYSDIFSLSRSPSRVPTTWLHTCTLVYGTTVFKILRVRFVLVLTQTDKNKFMYPMHISCELCRSLFLSSHSTNFPISKFALSECFLLMACEVLRIWGGFLDYEIPIQLFLLLFPKLSYFWTSIFVLSIEYPFKGLFLCCFLFTNSLCLSSSPSHRSLES